jgi:hypothetical protein
MFKDSIRVWEAPDYPEPVTDDDRDRIVANIQRALHACGRELHVQEPFDWSSVALRRPVMVPGSLSTLTSIGSPAKAAHVAPADSCGCGPDSTRERSAVLLVPCRTTLPRRCAASASTSQPSGNRRPVAAPASPCPGRNPATSTSVSCVSS